VADWMLNAPPKSVVGVGGIDYWKDGRDIFDNIQLVFEYPAGEKLLYSSITTNRHLEGRRIPGDGCREVIMGTDGAIELTLIPYGDGMWFRDPMKEKMGEQEASKEAWVAGATVADTIGQGDGLPIVPGIKDLNASNVGFIEREVEFAKRDFIDLLPRIAAALDDPTADYAVLPTYKLAQVAGQGLKVVLSRDASVPTAADRDAERALPDRSFPIVGRGLRLAPPDSAKEPALQPQ